MNIETAFNIGDKAWCFEWRHEPHVTQMTIGEIRVKITTKPHQGREEVYMCVETGIGTGITYTLGKHIFRTEEEAQAAWKATIKSK